MTPMGFFKPIYINYRLTHIQIDMEFCSLPDYELSMYIYYMYMHAIHILGYHKHDNMSVCVVAYSVAM